MNCPSCGETSPIARRYCTNCGIPLPRQCPSCGAANPPAAKFCGGCGSRFAVAEPLAGVSDSDAERRQLTVMFCDLVDSTGLASRLDPEEFAAVIRVFRGACADVVAGHNGMIAQFLGDGFIAYFGYPHAHEDDAERAIQTGLDIVDVVRGLKVGDGAHVRVGIATGLVVVGDATGGGVPEATVLGDTPNRAARLQAEAVPDTVVVGAITKRLAGGMFTYENLGERRLKGFPTPATVWRVVGPGHAESRFAALHGGALMPLIGRTREADALNQLWVAACNGRGHTILISGEPGIGKSRLSQILRQAQRRTDGAALRYYRCPMHGSGALQPVIRQIRRAAGMSNADSDDVRYKKLKTLLGPAVDTALPMLATLLSLGADGQQSSPTDSAQRVKEATLDVLVDMVVDRSASGPVLVICEDIHWIDPATLEYVDRLVARSREAPLVVVITFRSEFVPPWPDAPHVTRFDLERLSSMDTAALAHEVAGRRELPTEVLDQIINRTDGVPLFVEELTKMILDAGDLKEEDGVLRLRAPLPAASVPATLQDLLMARLDRPAPMKEVAQIAAAVGRSFSLELLAAATDLGREALVEALADLEQAGLIFRRAEAPEPLFEFKHALVRDAAYQSLLRSTRRRIHERVAEALVDRFPSICALEPERVAHHFTNARRPADAVNYWLKAGQRASQRSANTLAADYLDQAMRLLPQVGDRVARTGLELTILSAQGPILMASKGYAASEVEAVFARARTLCRHGGEATAQFRALRGLFLFHLTRGEIIQATELAGELSRHARRTGDDVSQFEADRVMGTGLFFQGQFVETRLCMQRVVEAYSREQHGHLAVALAQDPGTSGRIYLGWSEWYLGYPARACALLDDAVRLSRELRHPHTQAAALLFAAMLRVSRREPAAAKALADACIDLCREQRFPFWMATAGVVSGWATALQGEAEIGVERIRDGLEKWRQTGARLGVPMYLGMLAEALDKAGRADESVAPLDDALAMAKRNGERFWVAELHRLRGQALLSSGAEAAAEDSYCKALETARSQRARSMELRAAIGLARLWERKGMRPAARELLANVRKPFTEGFDCPDLVDSDALLARLVGADT